MKGVFGMVGLLITLAIVGILIKKQLFTAQQSMPALQQVVPATPGAADETQGQTVKQQAQQVQQQYKQALDAAMQQSRPIPDEK